MAALKMDATTGLYHQPEQPTPPHVGPQRELLIFAIYVEIGTQSEAKARTRLSELRKVYNGMFKEIESQTNYLIRSFIMPIKDGNSRIECIFSGSNTKSAPANMEELFGSLAPEEPEAKGFTVGANKHKIDPDWEAAAERLSDYSNMISRHALYE